MDLEAKRAGNHRTHGMSNTRIYDIYRGIQYRCGNPRKRVYVDISCQWGSFTDFYKDMGQSYDIHAKKHGEKYTTIERINSKGDYSKLNCRWATYAEQTRNTSRNRRVTLMGRTQCLSDWAKEMGIKKTTLFMRIDTYNWPIEKALTKKGSI